MRNGTAVTVVQCNDGPSFVGKTGRINWFDGRTAFVEFDDTALFPDEDYAFGLNELEWACDVCGKPMRHVDSNVHSDCEED